MSRSLADELRAWARSQWSDEPKIVTACAERIEFLEKQNKTLIDANQDIGGRYNELVDAARKLAEKHRETRDQLSVAMRLTHTKGRA